MESSYHTDVLRGRCQELPEVRSKVVRVFVSSTFTDTLSERDSLIESVFPQLKDYCRTKYGLEFQYSDMRWGITNESADNHSEMKTCLQEIQLCQKYSIATNFVVLLSHRYGSRPTPPIIHASLFEQLREIVDSDPNLASDAELLSQWYRKDTNCIPASYILQPISSILPNIKSKDIDEMKQASKEWNRINQQIRACLRQAAIKCHQQEKITANEYDDFFISITEKEIVNGILSAPNANQRTLCFIREIDGIHQHLADNKASKYIDLQYSADDQPVIDEEAERLLNRLKKKRIPNILQSKNIFSYTVPWTSNGINRHDHAQYIAQFNDDFYEAVKEQIDTCVQSRVTRVSDPLQHEILEHAIQCKTYVAKFHGRTDVLEKLKIYIKNEREHRPCIVYGASGCGKTSVLAKAATEALKWQSNRSVSVILRFLGTTPASSTVYKTILSISEHICKLYNLSMQIYSDTQQLRHQLENHLLVHIPSNEYLIILLDSIDQLETDAYDCQWLPVMFPSNVKCILSTLPDHGQILTNLKSIININPFLPDDIEDLLIHVPPFQSSTVEAVYNDWLIMKQRSLSDEQRLFINELMKDRTEILPLYMKLMFDIISTWHSYDPIDENLKKLKTVDDCIRYLFNHLKTVHNSLLFERAICYMTACRSGISQNELEDVLSLDDDVLKSVFEHYIPPIRRIPGILWTRIRNDLDEYITEKEADDLPVIYWYHRRFIEVANAQFISKMSSEQRKVVFQNMVDLYKETWKGKSKPFKIDDPKLVNKYNLNGSNGEIQANRFTTSQPIEFVDGEGRVQFNKRKLNELPSFLRQLTSNLAIPLAAEEIFFNYSFMRAKVACSPFEDISNDFQSIKSSSSYHLAQEVMETKKEIDILSMLYMIAGVQIQQYPENYPFEVTARLLSLFSIKPHITRLITQMDEQSPRYCSLIVPYCQLQPPGSGLIFSMNRHNASVVDMDFTDDQMTLISLSNRILVTNMQQAKIVLDINIPVLDEPYLNSTTLSEALNFHGGEEDAKNQSSSDESNDQYKQYLFLVNTQHHIYLVSANENIKFQQSSKVGYLTVEMLHKKRALCVIAEINGNYVECWNVATNQLFHRIDFPKSTLKYVLCAPVYAMIVIVLQDGTIHFYSISDWKKSAFVHRGTVNAGPHLDLAVIDDVMLILTFHVTIPLDFAMIGLKQFHDAQQVLSDDQTLKILVAFDPPIEPKPIINIILPDTETQGSFDRRKSSPLFMAKTNDSVYVIHKCEEKDISYVRIPGRFDVISIHAKHPHTLYTARGGIIAIYNWKCSPNEKDKNKIYHNYQFYTSIDISSSPVTFIKSSSDDASMFLCSMENGMIHAYFARHAREASKKMPSFPRTNEVIRTVQLLEKTAVTLDGAKRELTSWTYQHSTSVESTRSFLDNIIVNEFVLVSSMVHHESIFVVILTNNHWIEIYSTKSLQHESLFSLHVRSPARLHPTSNGNVYLLTCKGSVSSIVQQSTSDGEIKFSQTNDTQLTIPCLKMLSSVVTINGLEKLAVLADNGLSMAIWIPEQVIYVDINTSPYESISQLKSMISDRTEQWLLFHFNNRTLISGKINIDQSQKKGSVQFTSRKDIDKFCLKKQHLATYNNSTTQLRLHNIDAPATSYRSIELQGECQDLCFNELATYAFVLIKSRELFMYRVEDGRQLAKLYAYDLVSSMIADNDFIVLAMYDRRLLTLMIADPDDGTLSAKIRALPSRTAQRLSQSASKKLIEHMEKCADMSSSDDDDEEKSDIEEEKTTSDHSPMHKNMNKSEAQKLMQCTSLFRFVTRLNNRHSLSKMSSDDEMRAQIVNICYQNPDVLDIVQMVHDSKDEIQDGDDDNDVVSPNSAIQNEKPQEVEADLDDIRQKVVEYERQQLKGVQFVNASDRNPKIMNNYSVTSSTCTLT